MILFKTSPFEKIFFSTPELRITKLLGVHGYRKDQHIKSVVQDAAAKSIERLQEYCDPLGFFCIQEIKLLRGDKLILDSGIEFRCSLFETMLAGDTHLISFIVTLGNEVDDIIASFSKDIDEPLASLFLETASRLCLEQVLREARSKLIEHASTKKMELGNRMAPGYSYKVKNSSKRVMWELEEQRNLFDIFKDFNISVELMESFTMLPRMSRSGIFGLRKSSIDNRNIG